MNLNPLTQNNKRRYAPRVLDGQMSIAKKKLILIIGVTKNQISFVKGQNIES